MPYPTMISKQFVTLLTVVTVVAALAAAVPAAAQQEGSASSANRARRDTGAIQRDSAAGTLVGDDEVLIDARPELVSRTRVSFDSARAVSLSRLPGRRSMEIVSADTGSRAVTLRRVEIAAPRPGDPLRGRHVHSDTEECIYVLSGRGRTESDSGNHDLAPGDTLLIPAGETHVTRNTGSEPLVLLCFFPTARVTNRDAVK